MQPIVIAVLVMFTTWSVQTSADTFGSSVIVDRQTDFVELTSYMRVQFSEERDDQFISRFRGHLRSGRLAQDTGWTPAQSNYGYHDSGIWAYFRVVNSTAESFNLMIGSEISSPREFSVYVFDLNGDLQSRSEGGYRTPTFERDLRGSWLGARLTMSPDSERYVLIWKKTRGILDLTYGLRSESKHVSLEMKRLAIYTLCLGIAVALVFHNLSLFFSMQDPIYLYYILFVVGCSSTTIFLSGYHHLFWWSVPTRIENLFHASPSFLSASAVLFVGKFLRLSLRMPRFARVFYGVMVVCIGNIILTLINPILGAQVNGFLNVVVASMTLSACLYQYRTGVRYALFLLMAVSSPILATLVYYAGTFLLNVTVADDIFAPAFALEMLLMSVGLAERIASLRLRKKQLESNQLSLLNNTKVKAINDLAASVAHEVNNPLMVIYGGLSVNKELLRQRPIDEQKLYTVIDKIENQVTKITSMVQALRHYAIDEELLHPVTLKTLVHECLMLCETTSYTKMVDLQLARCECDVELKGNVSPFQRSLYAVIMFAIEQARTTPERSVQVSIVQEQEKIPAILIYCSSPHLQEIGILSNRAMNDEHLIDSLQLEYAAKQSVADLKESGAQITVESTSSSSTILIIPSSRHSMQGVDEKMVV